MVNTWMIRATVNPEAKLLNLCFNDVRDYEVFVGLLKEREADKCNIFSRFKKNPRSIFMTVTASVGDSCQKYEYEFTDCRLVGIADTEYIGAGEFGVSREELGHHVSYTTFKYKKMIIKEGECRNQSR